MAVLRKLIYSGSNASLNSLYVVGPITGSSFSGSIATASFAFTASYTNEIFSEGGTFADPINGISFSSSFCVFRAPYACQVQTLYAKRFGGNNCFINARKSGSGGYSFHTASNLTLTSDNIWFSSNSVQNTNYITGESLEIIISGSANNQIAVQLDFIRT